MSFRSDLDALTARHDVLASEVASKTRELEHATRMLDEAKARARLPVLDNIRVASPCPAKWSEMTGDDRVRHCGDCKKHVYNLSDMTREEAETLIIAKEGKLCVRYFQRKDGTILLKDCVVGVSKKRKRALFAAGAAAILAAGGAGIALRMTAAEDASYEELGEPPDDLHEVAGGLQPMPPDLHEVRGDIAPTHTAPDVADTDPAFTRR